MCILHVATEEFSFRVTGRIIINQNRAPWEGKIYIIVRNITNILLRAFVRYWRITGFENNFFLHSLQPEVRKKQNPILTRKDHFVDLGEEGEITLWWVLWPTSDDWRLKTAWHFRYYKRRWTYLLVKEYLKNKRIKFPKKIYYKKYVETYEILHSCIISEKLNSWDGKCSMSSTWNADTRNRSIL